MSEHPALTRAREIAWVTQWSGDMRVNMTRVIGAARMLERAYGKLDREHADTKILVVGLQATVDALKQELATRDRLVEMQQEST